MNFKQTNQNAKQRRSQSPVRFTQAKAIFQTQTAPIHVIENKTRVYFKGNVKYHQRITCRPPLKFKSGQTHIQIKKRKIKYPNKPAKSSRRAKKEVQLVQTPLKKKPVKIQNYTEKKANVKEIRYVRHENQARERKIYKPKTKAEIKQATLNVMGGTRANLKKRGMVLGRAKSSLASLPRLMSDIDEISRTLDQNKREKMALRDNRVISQKPPKKRKKDAKKPKKQAKVQEYKPVKNQKKMVHIRKKKKIHRVEEPNGNRTSFVPKRTSIVLNSRRYSQISLNENPVKNQQIHTPKNFQIFEGQKDFISTSGLTIKSGRAVLCNPRNPVKDTIHATSSHALESQAHEADSAAQSGGAKSTERAGNSREREKTPNCEQLGSSGIQYSVSA